tara:strand:+ start:275 stop:553 length:279 start_codon:yes stop_codon:yes gene_type:complete
MSKRIDKKYSGNNKSKKNKNINLQLEENLNNLVKEHLSLLQNSTEAIDKNEISKHSESLEESLKDTNINTLDKIYLLEYLNKIICEKEKNLV